jgi:hypothetical protein
VGGFDPYGPLRPRDQSVTTILVTGALGQVGKRCTDILLSRGRTVVAMDLPSDNAVAAAAELSDRAHPGTLVPVYSDMTDPAAGRHVVAQHRPIAERLTELAITDLSMMAELAHDDSAGYSGTIGLARLVMLAGSEPYLTRTRAQHEIILGARRDPDLEKTMHEFGMRFYGLTFDVIKQWYVGQPATEGLIEQRAMMVTTFISGVLMNFVNGYQVISDADHLDRLIRQILES